MEKNTNLTQHANSDASMAAIALK